MPISKLKASSIASGTIDNARISLDAAEIPALPTSKITSGTFDDARIAASNVSQHATSFDDNKLVNDLSTLGLRVPIFLLTIAADNFTIPRALTRGIGIFSTPILKFLRDLCVWAPQYLLLSTLIGPKASDSCLSFFTLNLQGY